MRIQKIPLVLLLISLSSGLTTSALAQRNQNADVDPSTESRPIYIQPVDFTKEDLGISEKAERIKHAKDTADHHFEKGMLYKQAGNSLFNAGHLKRAYTFYEKAEKELIKAADKYEKALPDPQSGREERPRSSDSGSQDSVADQEPSDQQRAASRAYYHLGLVCEKIRNDKSVAADCFAKARELNPSDTHIIRKMSKTNEGRKKLGVKSARDFKQLKDFRKKQTGLIENKGNFFEVTGNSIR